jgi:hypothetical protein
MTDDSAPLNREQRRAQKFHHNRNARQDNRQTQRENQTGFLADQTQLPPDVPDEATTQNDTRQTGPGMGGATESGERTPHHEGMHLGNPTKG